MTPWTHERLRTRRARVRAPELTGKGGWLNAGGQQYTLADLRGRIVILDFLDVLLHQLPPRPGRAGGQGHPPPSSRLRSSRGPIGPSTRLLVSSTPPELLIDGEGAGTELSRALELDPSVPEGVLHVSAMAASCDDDPDNEYPACHVHQQDWGVPVRLTESGTDRLPLVLAGMDT
ncbi:putative NHL repeat-containing protein 2 [Streptomyces azureus]|uniref:Putative NHL repeat-containing protein 2 n=1 Tax=Streptomyces azureus TaxID=146537 RepID=A0A0K8PIY1_STRAJ|nr:putative NHL repeat-containing protein 2 [Streptomyces azureus]